MDYINLLKKSQRIVKEKAELVVSRRIAKKKRKELIQLRGEKVVDKATLKEIKSYAKERFGSSFYWPWLALYTEVRGDYKPGWIPYDYLRIILRKKYNPKSASAISHYKSLDHRLVGEFAFKYLLYCISQNFYKGDGTPINYKAAQDILLSFDDEVIIKPECGWKGQGIEFSHSSNVDIRELSKKRDFLIQPLCSQCKELKKINPSSLNTLRFFTYFEPGNMPQMKFSILKFSMGKEKVDNTSAGGGYIRIHENGQLDEFYYDIYGMKRDRVHPITGIKFDEIKVPSYNEALAKCKLAHLKFPYIRFIGWDVAIDEDKKPQLIEWNGDDPGLWQAEALYGPFWKNDFKSGLC